MQTKKGRPPAKKPPVTAKGGKQKPGAPHTAQQTIPYRQMLPDGICQVNDQLYTKSIRYEDINYSVASSDDQAAIFDGYCAFLNYFDSALPFQLSVINHRSNPDSKYTVNIPSQQDEFNSVRGEYVSMLEHQIDKSNNGIVRSKYITFGLAAESLTIPRPRLERIEADLISNFKKLGVASRPHPPAAGKRYIHRIGHRAEIQLRPKTAGLPEEQGFLSSLLLGHNGIEIQRGMTTSSTAIFVPFLTQELRMDEEAVYYGMNALSHNVIMANRKKLKNPKGLYHKGTGTPRKTQAKPPFTALMDEYTPTKGATISRYQQLNRRSIECGNKKQAGLKTTSNSLCA